MKSSLKLLVVVSIGFIISIFPIPAGLTRESWIFFSLFISVVIGLIIEPYPAAYIGLLGVLTACFLKIGPVIPESGGLSTDKVLTWGLSGFSNSTVWLIFVAFLFASGFEKTGLGKRIALILVNRMGKKTLHLGYAISLADLCLAPVMPSNTARSGGIIFPILKNVPELFGSSPENNPRKIGAYITWVALASTCVTSSMFLTALAPNVLAVSLVKGAGLSSPGWLEWFLLFLPVGLILIFLIPLVTYWIYPPELKGSSLVADWAGKELKKMGRISSGEIKMITLFGMVLILWIFGETIGIHTTLSALLVLCLMVLFGILSWNDILSNKSAWNVLIWFGTLVTLAGGLNNVGFLSWLAQVITQSVIHLSPFAIMIVLVLAFYLIHYLFASITAHVTALLSLFLLTGMAVPGLDVQLFTFLMLFSIGLMGIITPYGTGPSPIWYGLGYIPSKTFWLLGIVFGILFLLVLIIVGIPWMHLWK